MKRKKVTRALHHALTVSLLLCAPLSSGHADHCFTRVLEYVRSDTETERRYPELSRMQRRDFAASMRALKGRSPSVIGLPIIERVLYRMAVDGDADAALRTRLEVADLEPGYLESLLSDLQAMPAPVSAFLTQAKSELALKLSEYVARGHLTYEELLKASQEFSAVATLLDPLRTPTDLPIPIFPIRERELDSRPASEEWQSWVINLPLSRTRLFLSEGMVTVPFRADKTPEEIASPIAHVVPVQVVALTTDADGITRSSWSYSWQHDHENHGNRLARNQPENRQGASPKRLRKSQGRIVPIENELRKLAEQRPDLPLIRELLYENGHETGIPHTWENIGETCLRLMMRDSARALEWAKVFAALETSGHREAERALRSRSPEADRLFRRLGLKKETDPAIRAAFLAGVSSTLEHHRSDRDTSMRYLQAALEFGMSGVSPATFHPLKPQILKLLDRLQAIEE